MGWGGADKITHLLGKNRNFSSLSFMFITKAFIYVRVWLHVIIGV